MKKTINEVNEIKGITGLNRNLDIICDNEENVGKVIGLALLDYADRTQGLELVFVNKDGKVGFVNEDEFEVREVDPLENVYIAPGPIYENKNNPFVNRDAEQFDDAYIPVEDISEGHIIPIQQGVDGALCQCQNGFDFNSCSNSGAVTDFHCFRCESKVKIRACDHNNFYYNCPFCGQSLT